MRKMKGFSDISRIRVFQKGDLTLIEKDLDLVTVLQKASRNWDGGYAMAGMVGHGDAFVIRDPAESDRHSIILMMSGVVASERPVIQTIFNIRTDNVIELPPAHAIIIKASGNISIEKIRMKLNRKMFL